MHKYRKILILIGLLLFSGLALWGVYYVFFKWSPGGNDEVVNAPGGIGKLPGIGTGFNAPIGGFGGNLPEGADVPLDQLPVEEIPETAPEVSDIARGGLTKALPISSDAVEDPQLQIGGNGLVYYNPVDGKFYRISADGKRKISLSQETFFAVEDVTWSRDQTKAVLEYPDGANIVYDFTTGNQTTLPKQAQDFSFSKDGANLAYEYIGGRAEDNWLTVSKTDGSGAEFVQALGNKADQVEVNWSPARTIVAMFRDSAGLNSEEIIFLGLKGENFKSIIVQGSKFEGIWSPRGDRIVYSVISPDTDYNPTLWTVGAIGENIGKDHVPLFISTWTDKCAFNQTGTTLYCGVPQDLPTGAGLDRGVVRNTSDDLYKINLDTGSRKLIARPVNDIGTSIQVGSLFVSPEEDVLFIWDTVTRTVYKIRLK